MSKGKEVESPYRTRCRSQVMPGRPGETRLTRTMGFVEQPQAPCMPALAGDASDREVDDADIASVH